jgi:hypothetical protein
VLNHGVHADAVVFFNLTDQPPTESMSSEIDKPIGICRREVTPPKHLTRSFS